jgi:hypothetical protein
MFTAENLNILRVIESQIRILEDLYNILLQFLGPPRTSEVALAPDADDRDREIQPAVDKVSQLISTLKMAKESIQGNIQELETARQSVSHIPPG